MSDTAELGYHVRAVAGYGEESLVVGRAVGDYGGVFRGKEHDVGIRHGLAAFGKGASCVPVPSLLKRFDVYGVAAHDHRDRIAPHGLADGLGGVVGVDFCRYVIMLKVVVDEVEVKARMFACYACERVGEGSVSEGV